MSPTIPTPTLSNRWHYSYELDPPLTVERADVVTDANGFPRRPLEGDVHRVGVFIHEHEGKPRPTVVIASTTAGRVRSCGVPLEGFPAGPNDDPSLLDVFADFIADAEQRHRYEAARAAHPAYAHHLGQWPTTVDQQERDAEGALSSTFPRDFPPPSRVPGEPRHLESVPSLIPAAAAWDLMTNGAPMPADLLDGGQA